MNLLFAIVPSMDVLIISTKFLLIYFGSSDKTPISLITKRFVLFDNASPSLTIH